MSKELEIIFLNRFDDIKLSGTLHLPNSEKNCPSVVLISGSGPQNRDQNIQGHKIFKDIAKSFSNNGIAVLCFDDRGIGKSEGVFDNATLQDFKGDVISAFYFLKEHPKVDSSNIGILGHSIGALIASLSAVDLKNQLSFFSFFSRNSTNWT